MILFKNRSQSDNWIVYHESIGNTHNLYFDATNAKHDRDDTFSDASPTSSVFTLGNASGVNNNTDSIIAYCFAPKQGFSKFGSYTGNGNADGAFVYLGFRPAWVMIKRTSSTQNWFIWDSKRLGYNVDNNHLQAQGNDAEGPADTLDLLSNGFKIRESGVGTNGSGDTYIYMAFAEQPFVNSNEVPCNAR